MMSKEEVKKLLEELQRQYDQWIVAMKNEFKKIEVASNIDEMTSGFITMLDGLLILDRVIILQKIQNYYDSNNVEVRKEYRNKLIELFKAGYKRR